MQYAGLLGTAQIDASTTLLELVDQAIHDGCAFNGSIIKRALKSLANIDFAQANWVGLTTTTKATIDTRFVKDPDDIEDANAFYGMLCSQIMQKSLRTATQKFKPKVPVFCHKKMFSH